MVHPGGQVNLHVEPTLCKRTSQGTFLDTEDIPENQCTSRDKGASIYRPNKTQLEDFFLPEVKCYVKPQN